MEWDDDEEQKDNVEEEQKGIVEELSENPPWTDLNNEMFSEYMAILEVNIINQSELKSILSVLSKLIDNIWKDPNEIKYHKIKLNNK